MCIIFHFDNANEANGRCQSTLFSGIPKGKPTINTRMKTFTASANLESQLCFKICHQIISPTLLYIILKSIYKYVHIPKYMFIEQNVYLVWLPHIILCHLGSRITVCVCVCVCVRERERERGSIGLGHKPQQGLEYFLAHIKIDRPKQKQVV